MPPLILHNVPDDELYVGEDGIQRPYAMIFPGVDNHSTARSRRAVAETGSFGKSTRRSRSRTNTPGPPKQADPTIAAAEIIFSAFVATAAENPSRTTKGGIASSLAAPILSATNPLGASDGNADASKRYVHKEPTEVVLRGFKPTHQYAAIREYEAIAGRICEDYPRDPPDSERRYKFDLRDPAVVRKTALTPAEKAKALRFAGGEHWIKITFESAEAAEIAVENSPQMILGHLVFAELYRGVPPTDAGENPAGGSGINGAEKRTPRSERFSKGANGGTGSLPRSFANSLSPGSNYSSQTLDTGTLSSATITSLPGNSIQFPSEPASSPSLDFCRRIPTAKKIRLLPAEQALLPQTSYSQRILSKIPLIGWLSSDIIGNQVPKTESGEFDWGKASLYWKVLWWVDDLTGWFDLGGEKEE